MIGDFLVAVSETQGKDYFNPAAIQRAIVDGQRGYVVTNINGVRCFYFRLEEALRSIIGYLDHATDRDLLVIGEPEEWNAW